MNAAAVRVRDLVLAYGAAVALERSSFDIPAGSLTAVIGPNGSGKSSLLDALAGLLDPVGGAVTIAPRAAGAPRIAYVLQATQVNETLPITVREVVTMGRYARASRFRRLSGADRRAVDRALERTGVAELGARRLRELSAGQRQRVFLAQGLAQDHDILLLDEPMMGIDMPTARAIDAVIHDEQRHGCTVVVTTHDLSEARAADHVLLLAGRVVAWGAPDRVLTLDNLTEAYRGSHVHPAAPLLIDDHVH